MTKGIENLIKARFIAIDHLNSWVRTTSGCEAMNSPRRRIYEAKGLALLDATRLLNAEHFALTVPVKCRDCGGSGRYDDGYRAFPHCWRCNSSGTVRLEFVESRIPGIAVWHTPKEYAYRLPITGEMSFASTEWDVNRSGKDLEPEDAAGYLLTIDEAWPPRYAGRHEQCYDRCDCTDRYSLYVGCWDRWCAHCRTGEPKYRFHKRVGRVECTLMACEACYAVKKGLSLFDACIPLEMYRSPNIMAWINKNSALSDGKASEVRAC